MQPLKLVALDKEDLEILSAHLQDAVLRVDDMAYVPAQKRFAVIVNRFDWEGAAGGNRKKRTDGFQRRRSALRFDRVLGSQLKGVKQSARNSVLELLAIRFEATGDPEGFIELIFSGGGAIRLQVECIEAEMKDLGPAWSTKSKPEHDEDAEERTRS